MKNRNHGLSEKEIELVKLLMADCESTGDIQAKLKKLFAGTIEQMLEAEMDEHLGYEKNAVLGNNSGNSRNGYGKKTITSDYGECEISVPRDRNARNHLCHHHDRIQRHRPRCMCPKSLVLSHLITVYFSIRDINTTVSTWMVRSSKSEPHRLGGQWRTDPVACIELPQRLEERKPYQES